MRRSLALALRLLTTGRGSVSETQDRRPDRPKGDLVWLYATSIDGVPALQQIASRISRERSEITLLVTANGLTAPDLTEFPEGTRADAAPAPPTGAAEAFLAHWRPDLVILTGDALPPGAIVSTSDRGIPLILADHRGVETGGALNLLQRGVIASLLPRFTRIFVPDTAASERVRALAGTAAGVIVAGRIDTAPDPLPCNDAERTALAEDIGTRPIWAAVACPLSEADAVLSAHGQALRLAHRMLLILVPDDISQGQEFVERAADQGIAASLRSREEPIDDEVQALIADTEGELGLWYRLAPVTYLGGTLTGEGNGRNPLEPAALGSAVIAGTRARRHADAHARLAEARALRLVRSSTALAEAVGELIAPDRAALLAHNAWQVSSGGAEAANAVQQAIFDLLDRADRKVPD